MEHETIETSVLSPKKDPYIRTSLLFLLFISITIALSALSYTYGKKTNQARPISPTPVQPAKVNDQKVDAKSDSFWINCTDVRAVISEQDTEYVGCLGGVLFIDPKTREVKDQLTTYNGLSHHTVTSLSKKDNVLYIGTQNGITIYDTISKEISYINEGHGLASNHNIIFRDDGQLLWIGTFKGLSTYDYQTKKISTFRSELADNSTIFSVSDVVVTPLSVYVSVIANVGSPGSIARFDKSTQSWSRFGPSAFLENVDQNSRVDFFRMESIGDSVFFQESGDLYTTKDGPTTSFTKIKSISEISNSANIRILSKENDRLLLLILNDDQDLYLYTPSDDHLEKVTDSPSYRQKVKEILNGRHVNIARRPLEFLNILAQIGHATILTTRNERYGSLGVTLYNSQVRSFDALIRDESVHIAPTVFWPIHNSRDIIVINQICEIGCDEPRAFLLDFSIWQTKPLRLPPSKNSSGEYGYIKPYTKGTGAQAKLLIEVNEKVYEFNPATTAWDSSTLEGATEFSFEKIYSYSFTTADGFTQISGPHSQGVPCDDYTCTVTEAGFFTRSK